MNNNIVMPTISTLPMDDIAAYLSEEFKFVEGKTSSFDTENVNGIPANKIAIAVSDKDRCTVKNAEQLGGKKASEYLTTQEGENISNISRNISEIYTSSLMNLENELYSIMNQLDKIGMIQSYPITHGFFDNFSKNNVKFDIAQYKVVEKNKVFDVNEATNIYHLYIDDISNMHLFDKEQYFVVINNKTEDYRVVKSFGISESNAILINCSEENIEIFLEDIEASDLTIKKTLGNYINRKFSFSEYKDNIFNRSKEKYTTQNDDTNTLFKNIENNVNGYATLFKMPRNVKGALSKFSIRGKCVGEPGGLICHVLKKESILDLNGNFNPKFTSLEDARLKDLIIASSKPLYSKIEYSINSDIVFDFQGTTKTDFPILEDDKYLFIIECLDYSSKNFWQFEFSFYNSPQGIEDVQKNNISYIFKKKIEENESIMQEIVNYDLIFSLASIEIIERDEYGYTEGLYTAPITLYTNSASKIRTEMKINREGLYVAEVKNFSSNPSNRKVITLNQYDSNSYSPFNNKFKKDDIIIIGNQICEIEEVTGATIILKDNLKIDSNILKLYTKTYYNEDNKTIIESIKLPAYRMNYEVYIKSNYIDFNKWNETTNSYEVKKVSPNSKMEIKEIIPDFNEDSAIIVFEKEIENNVDCNNFEFQIKWKSPYTVEEINNFKNKKNKELIGKITNLTVSFSKKC